ncbi:hypothetical protein GQ44DRAFT_707973 [Phaeosphaeriaceae sp. PMI808]|nr:hypothetical protein GQ44DRAFT_707973 [Phaeosphaeriaceae sp. PMI808]
MCFHNFTQHNGCGHMGETHACPWTLCPAALQRLNDLRGPNSPPISSVGATPNFAPPKRNSSTRRFFSIGSTLSRSNTTASIVSRRSTTSGAPSTSRDSMSSHGSFTPGVTGMEINYSTLPDHQLIAVRCAQPTKVSKVSRDMVVCKVCKRWIEDMRSMIARYDKTGSVMGTGAFEKFLKPAGDAGGGREGDFTVPLDDCLDGVRLGARQAIILGHPENAMGDEGSLEALERKLNRERGFC